MSAIFNSTVPEVRTVVQHIKETTDFQRVCDDFPAPKQAGLIAIPLPRSLFEGLRDAALQAIEEHGLHGWLSREGRHTEHSYQSLSLVHNPDLHDPGIRDVHQATLGTSINHGSEFFYNSVQRHQTLKNTYFDTYGFRSRTPASRIGALGQFLDDCRLTLVRSRLSVIYGDRTANEDFTEGWHKDEPVFENVRLNIPLTSDTAYRLQIEHELDKPDPSSNSMTEHYLEPGYAYTFNTHIPHRVYARSASNVPRIHLVLGFSPWYRHDAATDAWRQNEHYGKDHPLDLLAYGQLHRELNIEHG